MPATPEPSAPPERGAPERSPEPQPGPDPGADVEQRWAKILQELGPKLRAFYKEGRVSVEGAKVTLLFPYSFHYKMAKDNASEVLPHLRRWLGESATLEPRLQEAAPAGEARRRPIAPEEDPIVQEAVRKFEGRVTRVKETKT